MVNKSKRTDDIIREIEAAIESLVQKGLVYDTGKRRWSERTGAYQIVWATVPQKHAKH